MEVSAEVARTYKWEKQEGQNKGETQVQYIFLRKRLFFKKITDLLSGGKHIYDKIMKQISDHNTWHHNLPLGYFHGQHFVKRVPDQGLHSPTIHFQVPDQS